MIELSLYLGTLIGIYAIMAFALNLQYGFAGLLNFGLVAFFAIGAYSSALLSLNGMPIVLAAFLAVLISAIAGALIAIPTMKLSVHYWAIVTISIAELVRVVIQNEEWATGGTFGLGDIPQPLSATISQDWYPIFFFILTIAILAACYFMSSALVNSPYGRVLKAIREDEEYALSIGKNVPKFKLRTMAAGAAMIGLAGSLYAHFTTYLHPQAFEPLVTFIIWAAVILGGKGNLKGGILGALIIVLLYNSTRFIGDYIDLSASTIASIRLAVIGLLITTIVLVRPDGLLPEEKKVF